MRARLAALPMRLLRLSLQVACATNATNSRNETLPTLLDAFSSISESPSPILGHSKNEGVRITQTNATKRYRLTGLVPVEPRSAGLALSCGDACRARLPCAPRRESLRGCGALLSG